MTNAPLESPKNQQAHNTLRGYAFQSWLSVETWLDLKENDILFVECAEDYAVFNELKNEADISQAKNTAAKFTLRSDDVVDSINHYWNFRCQNTALRIRYCFVTTSDVTIEKGNPFKGTAGITLWMNVAENCDESELNTLITFLRTDATLKAKFTPSLSKFIQSSSSSDILETLIKPIIWDTQHREIAGIKEAVIVRLSSLLDKQFGVSSSHASNCADSLFTVIYDSGSEMKKSPLTRGHLLNTLENHIRPSQIAALSAQRNGLQGNIMASGSGPSQVWDFAKALPPTQIHESFSKREPAVKLLLESIRNAPFLMIEGSSGMGKSTLAQIVSFQIGGDWLHFRTRESDLNLIIRGLRESVSLIAEGTNPTCLIIDDLPWEKLDAAAFSTMRALSHVARQKGAHLIFTNHQAPVKRIFESANLANLNICKAPEMTDDEIIELSMLIGCADRSLAERWAKIIAIQTARHPQIIHAVIIELNAKGWPKVSIEEFQWTNKQVQEQREKCKILLAQRTQDELELLTRLSAFLGTFTREYAISVASEHVRISGAGVVFEKLLGPWIESTGGGKFQISNLIGKSLFTDLSEELRAQMNLFAAKSIMQTKNLDVSDAADALWNAISGKSSSYANPLILNFLMAPNEHHETLSLHLPWLQFIATEPKQTVFDDYPAVDFMLRVLQFKVCSDVAPDKSLQFLEFCDSTLESMTDDPFSDTLKLILAIAILSVKSDSVDISRVFWAIDMMKEKYPSLTSKMEADGMKIPKMPEIDFVDPEHSMMFYTASIVWLNANTLKGLRSLIDFLASQGESERVRILTEIFQFKALGLHTFDHIWLEVEREDERDWSQVLSLFNEVLDKAIEWECNSLAVCAAKGLSVIYDEYLNDTQAACETLDKIHSEDPENISVLSELRGKLALTVKDYNTAQSNFETALENNPFDLVGPESTLIHYHNAGSAAGRNDDWKASATHFINAHKLALDEEKWTRAVAFATDAAYSYWRIDEYQSCIDCLRDALSLCARMPDTREDLAALKVQKLLGNTLMQLAWAKDNTPDQEKSASITVGMCSNLVQNEALRDIPPPMLNFAWFFLLKLEFENTQSSDLWNSISPRLLKNQHIALRCQILDLQARKQIQECSYPELISTVENLAVAYYIGAQRKNDELFHEWSDTRLDDPTIRVQMEEVYSVPFILMIGISSAVISGIKLETILDPWRTYLERDSRITGLTEWLTKIEEAFNANRDTLITAVFESPLIWNRWSSCLRLTQEKQLDARALYGVSIFFLLKDWQSTPIGAMADLYQSLDPHLSKLWMQACNNRYHFKNPTLFIPEIKELSGKPDGTVQHLAKLILAAFAAINVNLPKGSFVEIKALAEKNNIPIED
tara:strand:+ start:9547 stop:13650 length:4104 start_codon:yes stop_codon:yes gene_type:complete